jgi:formylglycine-generating enzyme required for sulfatase activity
LKPKKGTYVETDRGYMVPYRMTIPGTEVSFEMVPVPGAKYQVKPQDNPDNPTWPLPIEVTIEPFWMARHEVTWAEYHNFVDLLKPFIRFEQLRIRKVTSENQIDAVTAPSELYDPPTYYPKAEKKEWPQHPAVGMTQYAAKQYTKWLSKLTEDFYRLPSEVEWEYACRAGSTTSYHFGDDAGELANYAWYLDNSAEDTHPVCLKKPNRLGLHDMHGNVSEWVLDEYNEKYVGLRVAVTAGQRPIHWPVRMHPRTVRGGSWNATAAECRSTARVGSSVDWHEEEPQLPPSPNWLASDVQRQIGFRIVRPLNPPPKLSHKKYWDADVLELKRSVAENASSYGFREGLVDPDLPSAIHQLDK